MGPNQSAQIHERRTEGRNEFVDQTPHRNQERVF